MATRACHALLQPLPLQAYQCTGMWNVAHHSAPTQSRTIRWLTEPHTLLANPSALCAALQPAGCCVTAVLASFTPAANISCIPGLADAMMGLPAACAAQGTPLPNGCDDDVQYALPVEQALAEHTCFADGTPVAVDCSGFDAHTMQCPSSVCSAICGMAALVYDGQAAPTPQQSSTKALLFGLVVFAGTLHCLHCATTTTLMHTAVLAVGLVTCCGVLACTTWVTGRPRWHRSMAVISDGRAYDALDVGTPTSAPHKRGEGGSIFGSWAPSNNRAIRGHLATAKSIKGLQPLALHSSMQEEGGTSEGMVEVVLSPAPLAGPTQGGVELISAFRKDTNNTFS